MTRTDPYSPSYDPTYRGQDDRDVGAGPDFAGDTGRLYLAGLTHLPDTAATYSGAARDAYYVEGMLRSLAGATGRREVASVADHALEMYDVLTVTSRRLYAAGEALVEIAADFVRTDRGVEDEMDAVVDRVRDVLASPPPHPIPPEPGFPWSLATPTELVPGNGRRPDIQFGSGLDDLPTDPGGELERRLAEHQRQQRSAQDGLSA